MAERLQIREFKMLYVERLESSIPKLCGPLNRNGCIVRNSYEGLEFVEWLVGKELLTSGDGALCKGLITQSGVGAISAVVKSGSMPILETYANAASFKSVRFIKDEDLSGVTNQWAPVSGWPLRPEWMRNQLVAIYIGTEGLILISSDFLAQSTYETILHCSNGQEIFWCLATADALINLHKDSSTVADNSIHSAATPEALKALAEEGPIIDLVNRILSNAAQLRASDIHIEGGEKLSTVKMRVDGVMLTHTKFEHMYHDATVCRLKILSNLDIAERRLPQDGRMQARLGGDAYDIRVSLLPSVFGESVVLRLLRQGKREITLQSLGMRADHQTLFREWMGFANGIVLVTGPTGSGKSTSLYAGLSSINDQTRKIITIEDPVEYQIAGIVQIQVESDIGLTFASTLRSTLRHDPDVILIGEIRDKETAEIAIQAALTGHLVFSTLHTNSALAALPRLMDMGVEPYLISAALRGSIAQRLVRRLCPHCSQPSANHGLLFSVCQTIGLDLSSTPIDMRICNPKGCEACNFTGYRERIALYDFQPMDQFATNLLKSVKIESVDFDKSLPMQRRHGLLKDGLFKVAGGLTTMEEVLSAVDFVDDAYLST
jgi:general secretion pathway protein E